MWMKSLVVAEARGTAEITTSSMQMTIKAIIEALRCLQTTHHRGALIITCPMSALQKVQKEYLCVDW